MALAILALNAFAVTDSEMDQARAIVGKYYVRYIDNGSGYLDDWTPASMKDLEGKLNAKGKEILAQFKKGAYPTDYASWDKDKLVAYWEESFFKENSSVLDNKAAGNSLAKKDIKKALNGMKVGAPAAPAASTTNTDGDAENQNSADAIADSVRMAQETAVDETLSRQEEAIAQAESEMLKDEEAEGEKGSGTWVYVMILAILVAVVIFLVVYASRTMKGEAKKDDESPEDTDFRPDFKEEEKEYGRFAPKPVASSKKEEPEDDGIPTAFMADSGITAETRMREKYAQTLASKSEEIRSLNRQLSELEGLAARLKEENRILKNELEQVRHQKSHTHEPRHSGGEHHHDSRHDAGAVKEVYLGRVNARGVFVRADRHAVEGQSIYRLTTTDGLEGKFSLIQTPDIEDQVLEYPGKWLAGGCFAKDIFDTDGHTAVKTEVPGTAVFRDGAWWVEKKAKIRYE